MLNLDSIRATAEADLQTALEQLDRKHRETLHAAIKEHGRVQDIPESVWEQIELSITEETAAVILLAIILADDWTSGEIAQQGMPRRSLTDKQKLGYFRDASRRSGELAISTTSSLRDKLARKVEDSRISGPGGLGELTDDGIDQALDDVFTPQRRETLAADQTTSGLSAGQRGAKERIMGGDGADTVAGQNVNVELYWSTERDDRVCPRCSPLHDQPESVWGRVFPNGPGPEAHPNCRCSLRPVVVVTQEQNA